MKRLLKALLIRDDEKETVFYFISFFFVISCGMAIGKASADALFFKRFGIEHLPIMYIAIGILLTTVSFAYAAFADRISAEKFFFRLFTILITILTSVWLLITYTDSTASYPIYFLVYETASEILLIHIALYLNQNLDSYKSKRLSPIIFAGSQLGIICGGLLVAIIAPIVGTSQLILIWCATLTLAGIMLITWHKLKGPSAYFYNKHSSGSLKKSLHSIKQGISFSRKSNLLRASSLTFFFLVIAFYILYYVTNQIYTNHFESEEELTAFFGILTAATGFTALLIQIFITNRVIDKFGIRTVNLFFPTAMALGFINLILLVKLPGAIIGSFIKDAIGPAFNKPVTNMMFNVLPKNIQGRSRAVSIGIILPLALFSCALILFFFQHFKDSNYFLIAGFITASLLLYFSTRVNKAYITTLIQHLKEQVYLPEKSLSIESEKSLLSSLNVNTYSTDNRLTISCAKILIQTHPKQATKIIAKTLFTSNNKTTDQLIRIVSNYSIEPLKNIIKAPENYPEIDQHLKATILYILFQKKVPFAENFIETSLNSSNPRLSAAGIFGSYRYQSNKNRAFANNTWTALTKAENTDFLSTLPLICIIGDADENNKTALIKSYNAGFLRLLETNNVDWKKQILNSMSTWAYEVTPQLRTTLLNLFDNKNPQLRAAVIKCSDLFDFTEQMSLLIRALEDGHNDVRKEAMLVLINNNPDTETIAKQWLVDNNSYISPRAQHTMLKQLLKRGITQSTLKKIAESKASLARTYYDSMQILKEHKEQSSAFYLTYSTVSERLHQTSLLLLSILEQFEETNIISVVKAAIDSADQELIASACEAIKSFDNKKISDLLIDILQDDFELKSNYTPTHNNINETLNWCMLQDQWLNTCSSKALHND